MRLRRPTSSQRTVYRPPSLCKDGKPHKYQMFKEKIVPDMRSGYNGPVSAYFKVLGCPGCKMKVYVDMVTG